MQFAVTKLPQMVKGVLPQKFEQLVYIDLVLQSINQMKNAEKDLFLLSSKHFYLITNYYEQCTYEEMKSELKKLQMEDLKSILLTNAQEILKSKQISVANFISIIPILSKNFNLNEFSYLIEEQLKEMLVVVKDRNECKKFSNISLTRFCKSMGYLLRAIDNQNLKQHYQSFIFQIILNKPNTQLRHIYSMLHQLQFIKYNQIISYLNQKQLAVEASKFILQRFRAQLNLEPEISQNPEFYSQLSSFLIKTNYLSQEDALFIEEQLLKNVQFKEEKVEFAYLKLMFCQLGKVGVGEKIIKKMLNVHKKMQLEKEFLPYYLMSLLYFQASRIMDQFKLNPTRQNMERLIKEPHFAQPLIDQALEAIKDFGYAQVAFPQESINQTKICQALLKCFNVKLFEEENIDVSSIQKNSTPGRTNEINSDVEDFLQSKGIQYIKEYSDGSYSYDYWIPNMNTIIECDGSFHYQTNSYDKKDGSTSARDFLILNSNRKLISINWFKQRENRFKEDKFGYISQLWSKIEKNPDIIYAE
ncbi:unnamed protein product (macronuclear) [Paramecium tetraurelia]|uniref:RAP domain-containing protein n=1 Tax=Paramecium tetraurelia TaxID=5888 RepID=A0DUZ2_PARTE|nr:uncharacterized protein GSPATT00020521001 [Paramecium tetraurelia]CAK86859.1 unnamed protein product [Paramecium tetraurelia]|eukprot:XP_001454256.1 hypothetical protein (macronuclear) [Paramecium tetraurelia strain d4-2]